MSKLVEVGQGRQLNELCLGIFVCESSLPYHSRIPCMTNIVNVKLQKISLSKPNVKLLLGMI